MLVAHPDPQELDGLVDVAAGLLQRVLAVHHTRAGLLPQRLDLRGADRGGAHAGVSSVVGSASGEASSGVWSLAGGAGSGDSPLALSRRAGATSVSGLRGDRGLGVGLRPAGLLEDLRLGRLLGGAVGPGGRRGGDLLAPDLGLGRRRLDPGGGGRLGLVGGGLRGGRLGLAAGLLLGGAALLLGRVLAGLLLAGVELQVALADDVADRAGDDVAGADRVVVPRDDVVDAVRVAVRVDQADDRDAQALGLVHRDRPRS